MKQEEKNPLVDFSDSLSRYMIRNSSWVYLFIIIMLLFGIVYGWSTVNQDKSDSTNEKLERYKQEFTDLRERVEQQEQRIQQLELMVETLQGQ